MTPPGASDEMPGTTFEKGPDQMLNIDTATRKELEEAAICEPGLYEALDEQKLLSETYETEELRAAIKDWIEASPDL